MSRTRATYLREQRRVNVRRTSHTPGPRHTYVGFLVCCHVVTMFETVASLGAIKFCGQRMPRVDHSPQQQPQATEGRTLTVWTSTLGRAPLACVIVEPGPSRAAEGLYGLSPVVVVRATWAMRGWSGDSDRSNMAFSTDLRRALHECRKAAGDLKIEWRCPVSQVTARCG